MRNRRSGAGASGRTDQPVCHRMPFPVRQVDVPAAACRLRDGTVAGRLQLLHGVRVRRGRSVRRRRQARGPGVRRGAGVLGARRGGVQRDGAKEKQDRRLRMQSRRAGVRERRGVLPEYLRAEEGEPAGAEAAAATCSFHSAGSLRER